jgi:hypothetical protein
VDPDKLWRVYQTSRLLDIRSTVAWLPPAWVRPVAVPEGQPTLTVLLLLRECTDAVFGDERWKSPPLRTVQGAWTKMLGKLANTTLEMEDSTLAPILDDIVSARDELRDLLEVALAALSPGTAGTAFLKSMTSLLKS